MKRPTFIQGAVVAFVFALAGAAAFTTLKLLLGSGFLLKFLISVLGGFYVLYLLSRSNEKTGRLTIPALWLSGAIAAWLFLPGLALFVITHLGMVWLIRSLYFHTSVLPALLDLGLCALSLVAAIATAQHSHSIFLTIWSFFLLQALFVAIPSLIKTHRAEPAEQSEQRFKRALRTAEAAVRRMHTTR
jgi:hypothetical protein